MLGAAQGGYTRFDLLARGEGDTEALEKGTRGLVTLSVQVLAKARAVR